MGGALVPDAQRVSASGVPIPGKRVQFDDETWQAIDAVLSRDGMTFQELTDEAFKDVLKKRKQPGGSEGGAEGERRRATKAPRGEELTSMTNEEQIERVAITVSRL
jgi:hypothetical protein